MNKLFLPILIVAAMGSVSCQKKADDTASVATSSDSVSSSASDSSTAYANYNPDYKTPPSNRIADAIAWTTAALNNRDSAGFWNSLTWEDRDPDGYTQLYRETRTLWDSTNGSRVDVTVRSTNVFSHSVHETKDFALFAHAIIDMRISGARSARFDSLTAILRVDDGKWLVGSFSQMNPNKPFRVGLSGQ